MNILYVGNLTTPLEEILSGKSESEITGWPAYFFPIYKLLHEGNNIDFAFISQLDHYNIKVNWFREEQIVVNINYSKEKKEKFGVISKALYAFIGRIKYFILLNRCIKNNGYDFIYCQEAAGAIGNILACIYRIPCGVRFYGDTIRVGNQITTKYNFISKYGAVTFFILKPLVFFEYRLKKSFVLTTADGTNGDKTYELLSHHKKNYDFYFWKTGVNKDFPHPDIDIDNEISGKKFIAYPSRIDGIKRQDLAVDVLAKVHSLGQYIHLYLIGAICDYTYYNDLLNKISKYGLQEYVHFTGSIPQEKLKYYAINAVANVLTGDYSNRGNVFFEIFSIGSVVISFDDGSLDEYLINGSSGFLVNNSHEMAEEVVNLLSIPGLREKISSTALEVAQEKVLSLEDRYDLEVELIKKYVHNTNRIFPTKLG